MGILDMLRGQCIDVIEWTDPGKDTMVHKYDMNGKEIMMKTVPSLTKYPLKLFYKKSVGDIVDLVRSKKQVPEDAIQAFIKEVEAL